MTAVQHTKQTPNIQHSKDNHSQKMEDTIRVVDRCTSDNHSNDNLDEIHETTDLDRYKISECPRDCHRTMGCELHKKGLEDGKGLIVKKWAGDVYGGARQAADLKGKCGWDAQEQLRTSGRTMEACARAVGLLVLLALLATSDAAPARSRPKRARDQTLVTKYLETFGYLEKGQLELANLVKEDSLKEYEDDFRIAIKNLQKFGGIPVTGEVDKATLKLMQQRRCGLPDKTEGLMYNRKKRFVVQGSMWKHTDLTWSMSSVDLPSQLDYNETRSVLRRALNVWQQASRLTFTEIQSDQADIVVSFVKRFHGDPYPFDGRGSILAHAFFPGTGRGGDAHFDDDELWLMQPKNDEEIGTSLFAVAVHEFGHSLGLSHSSDRGALMFPWYQGIIQHDFVLPEDDRNGIQNMYGPKEKKTWAKIPNFRPYVPPSTTTTTTTTTRRPYIFYPYNTRPTTHRPDYPRNPSNYPSIYPEKRPNLPERPYYPVRHHDTNEGRTHHSHHPRPTPETTTQLIVHRPRYPTKAPEYPNNPRYNRPIPPTRPTPKPRPYLPGKTTPRPSDKPDTCDTSYDAVALIRGELFIFKNRYHWRIGAKGRYPQYPIEISRMWSGLPRDLTHVDAVYERPDKKIAIFVGRELYLFDTQYLVRGYPKPLTHLGLPDHLQKLDAAMVWGHNKKTYFYSGNVYWKFDEDVGKVEPDYPRDMSMWKGVGYNIDSVFQWKDGKTYFFKGKGFWKFNDLHMRVESDQQLLSAHFWMGCPAERAGRRAPYHALPAPGSTLRSPSAAHAPTPAHLVITLASLLLLATNFLH